MSIYLKEIVFFLEYLLKIMTTKYTLLKVGNPETDNYYDSKGLLEYAWSHSVVSDQVYELTKRVCDFKLLDWTHPCNEAMNAVFKQYSEIDIYNIYAPKCNLHQSSSSAVEPDESSATKVINLQLNSSYFFSLLKDWIEGSETICCGVAERLCEENEKVLRV